MISYPIKFLEKCIIWWRKDPVQGLYSVSDVMLVYKEIYIPGPDMIFGPPDDLYEYHIICLGTRGSSGFSV